MPEGDTVIRAAARLHRAFAGRELTRAELRWPTLAAARLSGTTTIDVVARGKHLLHRFGDRRTLHTHLKMEGEWRVVDPGKLGGWGRNPDVRVLLSTGATAAVGVRLGSVDVVDTEAESDLVGHLGPDVLGADWDQLQAARNLTAASGTIGAALLDQRNLAGVGTLWAAESLFLEGVSPWSPAAELSDAGLSGLLDRVSVMMRYGARTGNQGGAAYLSGAMTHRRDATFVHARSGRPCRRCGGQVRVAAIGVPPRDRVMFYCPRCQGGLAPADDGRTQRPLGSTRR